MALGESSWPNMLEIDGVRWGVTSAGIKSADRFDIAVMEIVEGANVSGVFTQNAFLAEPVKIAKKHLAETAPRYLLINSGNANACTGVPGYAATKNTCEVLAKLADVRSAQILPFSTGVIGEVLPEKKITEALPRALKNVASGQWKSAAEALMTTDTRPKGASLEINWQGVSIKVSGIAKGAGMINPNMGTMLAYIATDADIDKSVLNKISLLAANKSFNRITIDGDTSTNDACMLVATGQSEAEKLTLAEGEYFEKLLNGISNVYQSLAQQIVLDGEGATKFVTVKVNGGKNSGECLNVAYAIAHSPLVKTAFFASDPNWGRIVAAIGYADISDLDVEKVKVWLDEVLVVDGGGRAESYLEDEGQRIFNQDRFTIGVQLGRGEAQEVLWTTDLSHQYIKINAEYRS